MKMMSLKEEILNLRKANKTYKEISEALICPKSLISYYCRKNNLGGNSNYKRITQKIKDDIIEIYIKQNKTAKETAELLGISKSSVINFANNKRKIMPLKQIKNYDEIKKFRKNRKQKCVDYKGGKCENCGYNKCLRSLDFHHLDPNEKDFNISRSIKSWEKTKIELDKCILLCRNCHGEIHDKLDRGM